MPRPPSPNPTSPSGEGLAAAFGEGPAASASRRVALFCTRFLPYSQTFVYDEIRHHERYSVEVFCWRRENADRFPLEAVRALGPDQGAWRTLESALYRQTLLSPSHYRRLRSGRFSLLHAHFGTTGLYTLPYQWALGVPLVVTVHGFDVPVLARSRLVSRIFRNRILRDRLLRKTNRFLAASQELAEMLVELGASRRRVHVWRLGVVLPEAPAESHPGSPQRVLMIGRLTEKKGFRFGIEAFSRLVRAHPAAVLHIVGDGELRTELGAQVADLGLSSRVVFRGVLSHTDTLREIERSDVLLAPSVVAANGDRDSGLIVVKEAAARGVPTIGTRHGGIPEIIDDGVTGLLVSERDVDALADRLRDGFDHPAELRRLGQAARRKMASEYDIVERVRALEQHYDEVIAEGAR